jgi:hypothetical protein
MPKRKLAKRPRYESLTPKKALELEAHFIGVARMNHKHSLTRTTMQ